MPDRPDPTAPVGRTEGAVVPAPTVSPEALSPEALSPEAVAPAPGRLGAVDRFFSISARGSDFGREIRGGFATFFTMAYILVLNPIILGTAEDKFGNHLSGPQLVTATALVAAVMTSSWASAAICRSPWPRVSASTPSSPSSSRR